MHRIAMNKISTWFPYIDDQQGKSEINMEMQKCGAYETVQLSRQKFTMKDNPAYGKVGFTSS